MSEIQDPQRRRLLLGMVAGASGLAGCAASPTASDRPAPSAVDAIVEAGASGPGRYSSIAAALAAAPADAERPYRILIRAGVWREKLQIDRPNVHLVGEGSDRTGISFGAAAGLLDPDGKPWGTFRSGTLTVNQPGFRAQDLRIDNSYANPEGFDADKMGGRQAVALALNKAADRAWLRRVRITSGQDTLLVDGPRVLIEDSTITGDVDFIFGGSRGLFERCEIVSRYRPGVQVQGYVAAPSTLQSQPVGLVFHQCRLSAEPQVPDQSAYLGRPWRAGNNMAIVPMAAYLDCWLGAHIAKAGWASMNYTDPEGVRRALTPAEVRFGEYRSTGPGASQSPDRPQLDAEQVAKLSRDAILQGWNPMA